MWVDQRTGSEFNVEIGARVVATQAGQVILIDDNEQVSIHSMICSIDLKYFL